MSSYWSSKKFLAVFSILMLIALAACESMHMGQSVTAQVTEVIPTETALPPFKINIPDKALWRNYLNLSLEAPAGTTCMLTYIAPVGATQQIDAIADENGLCEWRLKISEHEGKGHSRLIFTMNGISETHFIDVRPNF
jgi:hypothetical protein